jgi:hypothetical protein
MSDISAATARHKRPETAVHLRRAKPDGAKDTPGKLRINAQVCILEGIGDAA